MLQDKTVCPSLNFSFHMGSLDLLSKRLIQMFTDCVFNERKHATSRWSCKGHDPAMYQPYEKLLLTEMRYSALPSNNKSHLQ
jgi:hypothetical protein